MAQNGWLPQHQKSDTFCTAPSQRPQAGDAWAPKHGSYSDDDKLIPSPGCFLDSAGKGIFKDLSCNSAVDGGRWGVQSVNGILFAA